VKLNDRQQAILSATCEAARTQFGLEYMPEHRIRVRCPHEHRGRGLTQTLTALERRGLVRRRLMYHGWEWQPTERGVRVAEFKS
jgi:hypothetical protein